VRLCGEAIAEVFPAVPRGDFLDSILADVLSEKFGVGAVLKYPVYVVLNLCRTLAFLRNESVLSKAEGGRWALENLSARFHPVIEGALDEYLNSGNESRLPEEQLARFAVFMKNEIRRAAQSKTI
jgi:streptomycin 3"-adenylyltransferase